MVHSFNLNTEIVSTNIAINHPHSMSMSFPIKFSEKGWRYAFRNPSARCVTGSRFPINCNDFGSRESGIKIFPRNVNGLA